MGSLSLHEPGIILAIVVALGLAVLPLVRAIQRRRLRPLEPIFEPGTFRLAGIVPVRVEGRVDGYPCRYRIIDASKNNPGGAALDLGAAAPSQWRAARQNAVTRALSRAGVMADAEIGDAQLDEQMRFAAADPDGLAGEFRVESARESLRRLAGGDAFTSVGVRAGRLHVRWQPRRRGVDEDPKAVRRRIAEAIALAVALSYPPALR